MIGVFLARIIDFLANMLVLVIIITALVSYFLSPYHPVRMTLEKIVNPMLKPIRRILPMVGMIDFSPVVLVILIEVVSFILKYLVASL